MPDPTPVRLYDDDADALMRTEQFPKRVSLLPPDSGRRIEPGARLRILWGQDMLRDILDGRYRTVVCGVNEEDYAHGITPRSSSERSKVTTWTPNAVP